MRPLNGTVLASPRKLATALVVVALMATLVALLLPVRMFAGARAASATAVSWDDDGGGTTSTEHGPLTSMDRDFVRKVRLAGLWELPAGRQAQERGTTDSVRTAGDHLVEGHTELDEQAIATGRTLGVELANQPSDQQRAWLAQLSAAQGAEFDRLFANLLRRAHGTVFGLVAQVRAGTGNSMVRALATRANTVVLDHITVLEATGLVDFRGLVEESGRPGTQPVPREPGSPAQVPPAAPTPPARPEASRTGPTEDSPARPAGSERHTGGTHAATGPG